MEISHLAHIAKAKHIQETVKKLAQSGKQAKMFHGSTNSTRPPIDPDLAIIDVSDLNEIIEINIEDGYVITEPNVPLDTLVKATGKFGFTLPMVAEFPGITAGGAAQGGSGESSSHKYGLFSDTCLEYEVILGNGDRVFCSPTKNKDLFQGLACSFGSLGVLTAIKIKIIRSAKYVKLNYYPTENYKETISIVKEHVNKGAEFVDAIQLSKNKGVVVVGEYSHKKVGQVAHFAHAWNEWFYLHVEERLAQGIYEEPTPLTDYLFRYDRGGFWVAKYGFRGTKIQFNRMNRFLLSWMFKTRTLFKLLHSSGYSYRYVAQDICLPQETVNKFLEYNDTTTRIYPLWICPLKPTDNKLAPTALDTKLVINIGIWGEPQETGKDFRTLNRDIENKVHKLGGRKVLYAHAYYTPEEYWTIYDKKWYEKLRKKYHAEVLFPDVYRKTLTKPLTTEPSRRRALIGLLKSPYKH
ncbi:MAG TPA: FAD-binding protein [Candidatus Saccharimonadales bacterium]|nr:FAD-binding protein [Candidatus Saccharimonadales bacterium]